MNVITLSTQISERQCQHFIAAARHAFCSGYPLNSYITINWEDARVTSRPWAATSAYLKTVGAWLRRRGIPLVAVWSLENDAKVGIHAHIILHIPCDLLRQFKQRKRQRRWVMQSGATKWLPEYFHAKSVWHWDDETPIFSYLKSIERLTKYLLKAAEPSACQRFGIKPEHQGLIVGKRCGASETLGPAARAKAAMDLFTRHPSGVRIAGQYARRQRLLQLLEYESTGEDGDGAEIE